MLLPPPPLLQLLSGKIRTIDSIKIELKLIFLNCDFEMEYIYIRVYYVD